MLGTKNEKRIFQEKIVHMYLSIIKEENHLNENFWNEFFLLKANGGYLEQELLKLEHSEHRDRVLRVLFSKCSAVLENINQVKIINSLITLCSVTRFCLFQSDTPIKMMKMMAKRMNTIENGLNFSSLTMILNNLSRYSKKF
ncbi:hypothetical protein SSS_01812 [Sarcoptes scabiei]|nr:hypothetical protein SSS_01812 [Sarcoptes scabiei]